MPDDCGSTTVSASIIAMAASAAVPPARSISCPAAAARLSADETTPLTALAIGAAGLAKIGVGASAVEAASNRGRIMRMARL